jgi:hypothetical protein
VDAVIRPRRREYPSSWPERLAHRLPTVVLDQPWAIFIKALCIVSGLTTFLGPAPGSIESTLPRMVVYLWSATLVLGASAGLYGVLRPQHRRIEEAGLIWLGTAACVYGVTVLVQFRIAGAVPAGILLAFGLAALTRALAVHVSYAIASTAVAAGSADPDAYRHNQRQQ